MANAWFSGRAQFATLLATHLVIVRPDRAGFVLGHVRYFVTRTSKSWRFFAARQWSFPFVFKEINAEDACKG